MKIYTLLKIDIESGQIDDEISFEYDGLIAECKGDTTVAATPKSAEEIELDRQQVALLKQQVADNDAYRKYTEEMEPFTLESMGYERDSSGKIVKTGLAKAQDAMTAHQLAISGYDTSGNKLTEDQMLAEMSDTEKMDYETNKASKERLLKAYKGELDISPALEKELTSQETQAKEALMRKLGTNWMTSTAGQNAMRNLQEKNALIREEARQGIISSGEGINEARNNNTLSTNAKYSNLINLISGTGNDKLSRMMGYGNMLKGNAGNAFENSLSLSSKYASERANQQNLAYNQAVGNANRSANTTNSIMGTVGTVAMAAAVAY